MRDNNGAADAIAQARANVAREQLSRRLQDQTLTYGNTAFDVSQWQTRLILWSSFSVLWNDLPPEGRDEALQRMLRQVLKEKSAALVVAVSFVCALENTEAVARLAAADPSSAPLRKIASALVMDTCQAFEQVVGSGLAGPFNRICSLSNVEYTRACYLGIIRSRAATARMLWPLAD